MNEAAIADHGIIGDLQTAALVSTDGSVDWFCCPRFDSPSVFGALLDHERGGHFRVRPADEQYRTRQMYLPDSAVLITRFFTDSAVGEARGAAHTAPRLDGHRRRARLGRRELGPARGGHLGDPWRP